MRVVFLGRRRALSCFFLTEDALDCSGSDDVREMASVLYLAFLWGGLGVVNGCVLWFMLEERVAGIWWLKEKVIWFAFFGWFNCQPLSASMAPKYTKILQNLILYRVCESFDTLSDNSNCLRSIVKQSLTGVVRARCSPASDGFGPHA